MRQHQNLKKRENEKERCEIIYLCKFILNTFVVLDVFGMTPKASFAILDFPGLVLGSVVNASEDVWPSDEFVLDDIEDLV